MCHSGTLVAMATVRMKGLEKLLKISGVPDFIRISQKQNLHGPLQFLLIFLCASGIMVAIATVMMKTLKIH